jgi:hypothetical protein
MKQEHKDDWMAVLWGVLIIACVCWLTVLAVTAIRIPPPEVTQGE